MLADSTNGSGKRDEYDYYVNIDNRALKTAQKEARHDPVVLEKQFVYGMVLVGLSILNQPNQAPTDSDDVGADSDGRVSEEDLVATATSALAPVFLPMLEALGDLTAQED